MTRIVAPFTVLLTATRPFSPADRITWPTRGPTETFYVTLTPELVLMDRTHQQRQVNKEMKHILCNLSPSRDPNPAHNENMNKCLNMEWVVWIKDVASVWLVVNTCCWGRAQHSVKEPAPTAVLLWGIRWNIQSKIQSQNANKTGRWLLPLTSCRVLYGSDSHAIMRMQLHLHLWGGDLEDPQGPIAVSCSHTCTTFPGRGIPAYTATGLTA